MCIAYSRRAVYMRRSCHGSRQAVAKLAGSSHFSMPLTTDWNDLYQWLYSGCLLFPFRTLLALASCAHPPPSFLKNLPTVCHYIDATSSLYLPFQFLRSRFCLLEEFILVQEEIVSDALDGRVWSYEWVRWFIFEMEFYFCR